MSMMNMYGRSDAVRHYTPEVLSTDTVIKLKTQSVILCIMLNKDLAVFCALSRDNTP